MSDPVRDLKQELLAAAERHQGHAASSSPRDRSGAHRVRNRVLVVAALLPVAVAVSLFLTAPWKSSPGFLDEVQAALTPPAGTILHEKWESTMTSMDPLCTVTRGPDEIWIDQTPPHRYRVLLLNDVNPADTDAPSLACSRGGSEELGGTFDAGETLTFVAPNSLDANLRRFKFPVDHARELREAIGAGSAHDEGETQLDGRTVERIRIDPPRACPALGHMPAPCPREPSYAYVDPETFYPRQLEGPGFQGPPWVRLHIVVRILAYEYLPRTDENLALTDIRAQHPDAKGP